MRDREIEREMRAFAAPSIVTGSERSATMASDGSGRAGVRCDCVVPSIMTGKKMNREAESLAASTGALPMLQKSFSRLADPQTNAFPIRTLQILNN